MHHEHNIEKHFCEQMFNNCLFDHLQERRLHLESFKEKQTPVLVCTDVASRGLDTTNVGKKLKAVSF